MTAMTTYVQVPDENGTMANYIQFKETKDIHASTTCDFKIQSSAFFLKCCKNHKCRMTFIIGNCNLQLKILALKLS